MIADRIYSILKKKEKTVLKKFVLTSLLAFIFVFASCGQNVQPPVNLPEKETEENEYSTLLPFDAYYLDTYVKPFWKGTVEYNETVLFLGENDEAQLLYDVQEIIAVTSYGLNVYYEEGKDYEIVGNKIRRTKNSSIPYFTEDEYYPAQSTMKSLEAGRKYLLYGEGETFTSRQIAVTYTHAAEWSGAVPVNQSDKFVKTRNKLESKENVKILFYGDSITTGANSSKKTGVLPKAELYTEMVASYLKKTYGYDKISSYVNNDKTDDNPSPDTTEPSGNESVIEYINTAVGGQDSNWALANYENRVVKFAPDLLFIAFGMNDKTRTAAYFYDKMNQLVSAIKEKLPDTEIMLVSTSIPNKYAAAAASGTPFFKEQDKFEAELKKIADGKGDVGLANVTSLNAELLKRKRFRDMTGNNINHPNDYLARLYAQVIIASLGL